MRMTGRQFGVKSGDPAFTAALYASSRVREHRVPYGPADGQSPGSDPGDLVHHQPAGRI